MDGIDVGHIPSRFEMHPNWTPIFRFGSAVSHIAYWKQASLLKLVEKSLPSLQQLEGCK